MLSMLRYNKSRGTLPMMQMYGYLLTASFYDKINALKVVDK